MRKARGGCDECGRLSPSLLDSGGRLLVAALRILRGHDTGAANRPGAVFVHRYVNSLRAEATPKNAGQRNGGDISPEQHQRQHGANAGGGRSGDDGNRLDETLKEYAEHDVDGDQGGQGQLICVLTVTMTHRLSRFVQEGLCFASIRTDRIDAVVYPASLVTFGCAR